MCLWCKRQSVLLFLLSCYLAVFSIFSCFSCSPWLNGWVVCIVAMAPIHHECRSLQRSGVSLSLLRTWDCMFCGRICGSAYPLPSTWPALGIYSLPSGNIESIHSRGLARTDVARQSIIDTLLPYGAHTQFVSQPSAQRVSVLMCSWATLVGKWRDDLPVIQ